MSSLFEQSTIPRRVVSSSCHRHDFVLFPAWLNQTVTRRHGETACKLLRNCSVNNSVTWHSKWQVARHYIDDDMVQRPRQHSAVWKITITGWFCLRQMRRLLFGLLNGDICFGVSLFDNAQFHETEFALKPFIFIAIRRRRVRFI